MPLYPAIAILTVHRDRARLPRARSGLAATPAALLIPFIPAALTVGLVAAGWVLDGIVPFTALPFLHRRDRRVSVFAWRLFASGQVARSALVGVAASPLLAIGVFGFAQGDLRSLKISPRLAEAARGMPARRRGSRRSATASRASSSSPAPGSKCWRAGSRRRCSCRARRAGWSSWRAGSRRLSEREAKRLEIVPALSTRVTGFNINGGRRLDIGAYAVSP